MRGLVRLLVGSVDQPKQTVPAETVFILSFLPRSEGFAIEEEFTLISGSVNMHWRDLPLTARPSPVRQYVRHWQLGPPTRLVEIKPIFSEAREINDSEVGTARRNLYFAEGLQFLGSFRPGLRGVVVQEISCVASYGVGSPR